eukprot:1987128-Prymnesium_polylepis.1
MGYVPEGGGAGAPAERPAQIARADRRRLLYAHRQMGGHAGGGAAVGATAGVAARGGGGEQVQVLEGIVQLPLSPTASLFRVWSS